MPLAPKNGTPVPVELKIASVHLLEVLPLAVIDAKARLVPEHWLRFRGESLMWLSSD